MKEDHDSLKSLDSKLPVPCIRCGLIYEISQQYCGDSCCPKNEKVCRNCGSDPYNPKTEYCPTCGGFVVDSDPTCYDPECYYKKVNSIISLELYYDKEVHTDKKEVPFKYNEKALIEELQKYVEGTYKQHYVGEDNIQSLDLIFSAGHGIGFCIGNNLKLAARYGKKAGFNRDDLLKMAHYAILLMYLLDKQNSKGK